MICCVLVFYGISSCRKDAAEKSFGLQPASMSDSLLQFSAPNGLLIISPAKSDTGFDVNSGIVIKGNSLMDVKRINLSKLILKKGSQVISGNIESSDTLVTFFPDVALE